jgi:hypothetical protein
MDEKWDENGINMLQKHPTNIAHINLVISYHPS